MKRIGWLLLLLLVALPAVAQTWTLKSFKDGGMTFSDGRTEYDVACRMFHHGIFHYAYPFGFVTAMHDMRGTDRCFPFPPDTQFTFVVANNRLTGVASARGESAEFSYKITSQRAAVAAVPSATTNATAADAAAAPAKKPRARPVFNGRDVVCEDK